MWLDDHLDQFVRRVIRDAFNEATARYWVHRADQMEAALWRPGDYTGQSTSSELAARDQRLRESARACRNRAILAAMVWTRGEAQ